jgi:hypothetical protein
MHRILPLAALVLLATAACREEPTVAEQFNELRADIENKGRTYDAEAENLVVEQERRLAEEANALLTQNANLLGNAGETEVDVNSGEIEIDTR